MAAALKAMHLQETVVLEDDSDTMIRLVGKRRRLLDYLHSRDFERYKGLIEKLGIRR